MTDLSQLSVSDLFQAEVESQAKVLTSSLLSLERRPNAAEDLEACMRAAHSLKGAARIVQADSAVALAHAMEDLFVAAQRGRLRLDQGAIDLLLRGVDLMSATAAPILTPGRSPGAWRPMSVSWKPCWSQAPPVRRRSLRN